MFDLAKKYSYDKEKEIEGVWEEIGGGAELLIARMGNPNFQKEYARIPRAVQQEIDNKTIDEEEGGVLLANVLAKTILLGWKGLADNKKEIKYSEKNAIDFLSKYDDFRQLVIELSNNREIFHKAAVEDDIKN